MTLLIFSLFPNLSFKLVSSFLKFLRGVYDRYLIRGRIENYEKKLYGEIEEFRKEVKSFLVLSGISTADVT